MSEEILIQAIKETAKHFLIVIPIIFLGFILLNIVLKGGFEFSIFLSEPWLFIGFIVFIFILNVFYEYDRINRAIKTRTVWKKIREEEKRWRRK